jgi:hypothetical protein
MTKEFDDVIITLMKGNELYSGKKIPIWFGTPNRFTIEEITFPIPQQDLKGLAKRLIKKGRKMDIEHNPIGSI